MIEYSIPESEEDIPDDAFNGCVTLKKLTIHAGIKQIRKRAFSGLDFSYLYITQSGELIFSQEQLESIKEYKEKIDLSILKSIFSGFDYTIVLQKEKLSKLIILSEKLKQKKF